MSNHRRASFLLIHSAVDALRSVCNPFCCLKHFNDWTNLFHSQLVVIVIITLDCRFRITFTQCKQLLQFLFHYFFRIKYAECVGYIKTHITSLSVRGCLTSSLYSGASILSLLTCESGIRVRDRFIMVSIWHENSGENVNGKEHNFIERRIKFSLNIKKKWSERLVNFVLNITENSSTGFNTLHCMNECHICVYVHIVGPPYVLAHSMSEY